MPASHAAHADLVLISHLHADHAHLPSLDSSQRPRFFSSRQVHGGCSSQSPPGACRSTVEPGDLAQFGGLRISVSPPTTMAAGTVEALIADQLSATWSMDTTDAGIRGTRVRTLRSMRWHALTSPSCQLEDGTYLGQLSRCAASGSRDQQHASDQCCPRALGHLVAHRPSATACSDRSASRGLADGRSIAPNTRVHILRHGQSVRL